MSDVHPDPVYTRAFEEVREELERMPAREVKPIRHDIMAAVILALGCLPNARSLRRHIEAEFGPEAARCVDRFEVVARACAKAHALHLATLQGADTEPMAGELAHVRRVLTLEADILVARGMLPAGVLAELVGGTSYAGLCLDVLQLVSIFRRALPDGRVQTGVTEAEVDRAEVLANRFMTTLGEIEVGSVSSPTADLRRRAYTLFVNAHDEVRRYATYLRWEERDADQLVPPLGAGRERSRGEDETPPVAAGVPGASALENH